MRTSPPPHRILLVDCDAFFVQVARLEDPEGAGRAELLIVGGSPTGRGVVTSASYACRTYGVRSAMPTAQALRLCPDALVVPVSRGACGERSRTVRRTLEGLSPVVQAASIDEFFLDLSGTERLLRGESLTDSALRIRETVLERTDIQVSIGGGTNRLVAKLAAGRAKPAGVHVVEAGDEAAFVRTLRLEELPGVGPALLDTLARRGLRTVDEALRVDGAWLERWLGPGRARWLGERMRGIDRGGVTGDEARKSVSSERTFAADLDDDDRLDRELLRLVVSVTGVLRRKGLRARTVTVKLRDADFTTRQRSHTLPDPVESEAAVFQTTRELLAELRRRRRTGARLLGVGLSTLVERDAPDQLALFERAGRSETERERTLARTVDRVRARFGRDALLPGRLAGGAGDRHQRDEHFDDEPTPDDDRGESGP
jgi:DNA polymerase-4